MTDDRLSRALTAALHSPDFALRFLSQAPAAERAEALRRWAASADGAPAPALAKAAPSVPGASAEPRPGLRKCGASRAPAQSPATQSHDLALQLAAFARSIGRVS
jgi:hypothetical protein